MPGCSLLASRIKDHCSADLVLLYSSFVPQTLSRDRGPKWNAEGKNCDGDGLNASSLYTKVVYEGVRNSANVQCNSYLFSSQDHKDNNFYTLGIFFSNFKGAAYSNNIS